MLQVHDGPAESAPLLAKVCGFSPPDPVFSTQNVIYVRFRSDISSNHRGFKAEFSEGQWPHKWILYCHMQCHILMRDYKMTLFLFFSACGSTIMADDVGGAIASPRYPYPYPNNQVCSWIIIAQEPCVWTFSFYFHDFIIFGYISVILTIWIFISCTNSQSCDIVLHWLWVGNGEQQLLAWCSRDPWWRQLWGTISW